MGCVGLIRIICRISRTLFPPNHITKTDRKCQQNRIPPPLFPAHIFTSIMMIIPLPRNFFPSLPEPYFVPPPPAGPPPDGPAFVSALIWFSCSLERGSRLSPPLENRAAPPEPPGRGPRGPGPHHPIQAAGARRGKPPAPHTHAPAGKYPAGEDCQARAGARKHFRKHSFWLDFLVLYEIRILPSLS